MRSAFAELVRETPLVAAPALGPEVWLKLEHLQRTGSFKLRGACRKLDALTAEERKRGVIAASAGNHGQGIALAAGLLGIDAEIVVPKTTPEVKKQAIAALGGKIIELGASYDEADAAARERARASGRVWASPFDDDEVMAGNGGSLGAEIRRQLPGVAAVVASVGGGGLMGGLARELAPRGVKAIGVQSRVNCAMHDSLAAGRALTTYTGGSSLAEVLEGAVAERTFAACRDHGVKVALVDEAAIARALAFAYRRLGVIVDPGAAVAVAGVREGAVKIDGPTVVVLCGAHVDPALLDRVLRENPDA